MTALYERAPGWDSPPAGRCRPGMTELRKYLVERFGGVNLGCYGDRAKTNGSTPSLHRDGRAVDIGWLKDGKVYLDEREAAYEWLIANADALGLQMVLNYKRDGYGGTRWRLPYYVGDRSAGRGTWSSSGHWLHIERTNAGADDRRPIATILGELEVPPPAPPTPPPTSPPPAPSPSETVTVTLDLPVLSTTRPGTELAVKQLQTLLNVKGAQGLTVDGKFGAATEKAVRNWQTFFGLKVDGWVGAQTWSSVLGLV